MFEFIVLALATWRITSLLVNEDGPFDMLERFRRLIGIDEVYINGKVQTTYSNTFAKGLTCLWCTSVWVGLFFAVLYFFFSTIAFYVALPFALSALAVFFEELAT